MCSGRCLDYHLTVCLPAALCGDGNSAQQCEEIARSGEDSIESAKVRRNLGRALYGQGEHEKAKQELTKARK